MADGEVVCGEACGFDVLIDPRIVWVADDLIVTMIFHQDDEDVVQMGNAVRHGAYLCGSFSRDCSCEQTDEE